MKDQLEAVSGVIKCSDNITGIGTIGNQHELEPSAQSLVTNIQELKLKVEKDGEENSELNEIVQNEKKDMVNFNQETNISGGCKLPSDLTEINEDKLSDTQSGLKDDDHFENDDIDELVNISESNKEFRPFRNEESLTHVNTHLQRDSDSTSQASTQSTMDPRVIREKVKRQQKKKQEVLKARRIRKSGEAALQTKLRRDTNQDIKQSYDWF